MTSDRRCIGICRDIGGTNLHQSLNRQMKTGKLHVFQPVTKIEINVVGWNGACDVKERRKGKEPC